YNEPQYKKNINMIVAQTMPSGALGAQFPPSSSKVSNEKEQLATPSTELWDCHLLSAFDHSIVQEV
ncbi:hypothetical protein, partial [Crocosphaera watsonii]|uniref:hypothetical protein n=1 Tax=Crocosphaera watsonii TaxID=263511 RepID=UPI000651FE36